MGFVPHSYLLQLFEELQDHCGFSLDAVASLFSVSSSAVDFQGNTLNWHKKVNIHQSMQKKNFRRSYTPVRFILLLEYLHRQGLSQSDTVDWLVAEGTFKAAEASRLHGAISQDRTFAGRLADLKEQAASRLGLDTE